MAPTAAGPRFTIMLTNHHHETQETATGATAALRKTATRSNTIKKRQKTAETEPTAAKTDTARA